MKVARFFYFKGIMFIIPSNQGVPPENGKPLAAANQHNITEIILPSKFTWDNPKQPYFTQHFVGEVCPSCLNLAAVSGLCILCTSMKGQQQSKTSAQWQRGIKKKGHEVTRVWHACRTSIIFSVQVVLSLAGWSKYLVAGHSSNKF